MSTISLVHNYPVSADKLWNLVVDYDALHQVMKGIISFDGLPNGRAQTGHQINVMVSLFGRLPKQPYYMEILECDDQRRIMRSSEKGAGVKSWFHTLSVETTPEGSRLAESISIDAGLLTPLFTAWAGYLYRARHKPRLRLLGAL